LGLLCVFTIFNVYARILQFVGIDSDDVIDSEESNILLREGTMLLDQATRKNRKHMSGSSNGGSGGGGSSSSTVSHRVPSTTSFNRNKEIVLSPMYNKHEEDPDV
jgi:hypothetical protein